MTPKQIAAALGDREHGDEVLAGLDASAPPGVARAIREGFRKGDEQGNARRLRALVELEGEGCLDVLCAVLEDTVEVGGIYSNLRNSTLEIIVERFKGHPALATPLWRAIELDDFMNPGPLYEVAAVYEPARALALLVAQAERKHPMGKKALEALAALPEGRPALQQLLDTALGGDEADEFIGALGARAFDPDLAARIAPLADKSPAAAEVAVTTDLECARRAAERLDSHDVRWRQVAYRALQCLPADEAFERASPFFVATDRAKPAGRGRLAWFTEHFDAFARPLDSRWLPFLTEQLSRENDAKVRAYVVSALGALGPEATLALLEGVGDDDVAAVFGALANALAALGPDGGVLEQVRVAAAKAKGKRKKALTKALAMLEGD